MHRRVKHRRPIRTVQRRDSVIKKLWDLRYNKNDKDDGWHGTTLLFPSSYTAVILHSPKCQSRDLHTVSLQILQELHKGESHTKLTASDLETTMCWIQSLPAWHILQRRRVSFQPTSNNMNSTRSGVIKLFFPSQKSILASRNKFVPFTRKSILPFVKTSSI